MNGVSRRSPELLLLLSCACAQADGSEVSSLPEPAGATRACDAAACTALAGPCQIGSCDARTGACRLGAAREGDACLEGNACGPALCRQGECTALAPPSCPAAGQCQIGVCRPERGGCVDEPLHAAGASCETAIPLQSFATGLASANTLCGDTSRGAGCSSGARGPSAHFALDLSSATGPTQVALVIDADFAFEAVLRRGPCEDSAFQVCADEFQADRRSRRLSLELPPDDYELVVTGSAESDHGLVSVATAIAANSCSSPAANDECEAALALDATLPVQSVIGNATCGSVSLPQSCGFESVGDVFYELDLSSRTEPTLLELDLGNVDPDRFEVELGASLLPAEVSCGTATACGTRFASRVLPGRYRIGVTQLPELRGAGGSSEAGYRSATTMGPPEVSAFALRVRLSAADCSAPANDTWQSAIELDPNLELQLLSGNTACARDDFSNACNTDRGAPDLFYRLDLRGQPGPRSAFLSGPSDSNLFVYLLVPDATGVPSEVAGCEVLSPATVAYTTTIDVAGFELAPRLYYLVLDGRGSNGGRFDLTLRQVEAYPVPVKCFNYISVRCLVDSEPACADSRANLECLQAALECGLNPAVYEAFCAGFPGCCEGTADAQECEAAWRANLECN